MFQVLLHAYLDLLRPDDDREMNHHDDNEMNSHEYENSVLELFKKSSKVCKKFDTINFIFLLRLFLWKKGRSLGGQGGNFMY